MVTKTTFDPQSFYLNPSLKGFQGQVASFKKIVEVICKTESTTDVSLLKVQQVQLKGFEALAISTQNNSANKEDISSSLANAKDLLIACNNLIMLREQMPKGQTGCKAGSYTVILSEKDLAIAKEYTFLLNQYTSFFGIKLARLSQISQPNQPKEKPKKETRSCNASMICVSFAILVMAAAYIGISTKSL